MCLKQFVSYVEKNLNVKRGVFENMNRENESIYTVRSSVAGLG